MGRRFFLDGYIVDGLDYMLQLRSTGPARIEHHDVHKGPRARGFN